MIKIIKTALLTLLISSFVAVPVMVSSQAGADTLFNSSTQDACSGINVGGTSACTGNQGGLDHILSVIVNILSLVVGIVAVIMVIIAGLSFITSGGDTNKLSSAKSTLLYALIGIAVAGLAQVLVIFVLNKTKAK
jgi:hypothetical protein